MKQYPHAPQSYFRILNIEELREKFLSNPDGAMVFEYPQYSLREIIEYVDQGMAGAHKKQFDLVIASLQLRAEATSQAVEEYRYRNADLYGEPDPKYAHGIVGRALMNAKDDQPDIARYFEQNIERLDSVAVLPAPSTELFRTLKGHLERYVDFASIDVSLPLPEMLLQALRNTKLEQEGWRIEIVDGSRAASTIHRYKKIILGEKYRPRSEMSKLQIVLHEVYGHALRGYQGDIEESEGFATILEQLLFDRYKSRRSYRYLAIALGWGVFGEPMDFCQVYEILWRVMAVGGWYNEEEAKSHAFSECIRAFRGGLPDVAGTVFLKDTLYFKANNRVWQKFDERPPSYEDFCEIIEGRQKILV